MEYFYLLEKLQILVTKINYKNKGKKDKRANK